MTTGDTSRISPTAHYTGYIWRRNGMSPAALATRRGWAMFHALRPFTAAYELAGGPSLDLSLLARHRVIDTLLASAIERGEVGQVVEVAAGLSPRGCEFAPRYAGAGLRGYIEGDLPGMAARKRRILERAGLTSENHRVVHLDALCDDGPASIFSVGDRLLDPELGTAVITEGLLGYFAPEVVANVWARLARFLSRYPRGLYLFDLNLGSDTRGLAGAWLFQRLLTAVARGRVYAHFRGPQEAEAALLRAGFDAAELRRANDRVRALGLEHTPGLQRVDLARIVNIAVARTGEAG